MSHSDLYIMQQRAALIRAAADQAENVFIAFAVAASIIGGLGVFFAAPLCAVFGARLAACYVFLFSGCAFGALFIAAHVARFIVFNVKTWNV